jgi:hypothetical protein
MRRFRPAVLACSAIAALAAAFAPPAPAAPAATGPEVRAFLGGRTGKIVYLRNQLRQLHFIDLSDSVLTERRIAEDSYCLSPMIHPDGSRIVYESGFAVYIRHLEENSQERILVHQGTPRNGLSFEPRWWIHPKTGDEYVIYSDGDIADEEWPPKSGQTWIQRIDKGTGLPAGGRTTLLPFMMSGGRSKDGAWGAVSHHSTGMYRFYPPDKVDNALFDMKNWLDSGALLACNASISPSAVPARQNRMMHLTSGLAAAGGQWFDNHEAIIIRSWDDPDADHPLWHMGIPGVRSNDDGSGNLFWDHPEWSTHEDYFTAVGSKVVSGWSEADLYVGRISYEGENKILRVLEGGGINHYPHLWVKEGEAPARIRLLGGSLSFLSLKRDTANPGPDTLLAVNSGDGALPPLVVDSLPAWLKVEMEGNGTDTVRLIHTVDRSGLDPGEYRAQVTVSFGQKADSVAYAVTFRYSDPVLTSLVPLRKRHVLLPGEGVRLEARAVDQAGEPFSPAPAIQWQALGTLAVSGGDSVFVDSGAARGRYSFRGHVAGGPACTVTVAVAGRRIRLDAGAAADSLAPGWTSDADLITGDRDSRPGSAVGMSGLADPAPDAVYRSVRKPAGAWTLDVPNGRYAARFHFAGFPGAAGGKVDAMLEGLRLLDGYDPPAPADSGVAADAREVEVTVSDGDGLSIEMEAASGTASLAGLEVWDVGALPLETTFPAGGETFRVGDTLRVKWVTDGFISSAGIQFSPDSGRSWIPVTRRSSVNLGQPDWGDYPWVIPDSLDGVSLVTERAVLSVYDYFGTDRDRTDRAFSILPAAEVSVRPGPVRDGDITLERAAGGRLALGLPYPGRYRVALVDPRGRLALRTEVAGPGQVLLPVSGLPRGIYRLAVEGPGVRRVRAVTLLE